MSNNLLEPNYWSIKQLFDYQFIVPVYQRPYSWQMDQVESLYDDIWDAYNEYKNLPENARYLSGLYVGNIILHSRSMGTFDIIDGQQRITTFALMIMALYSKSVELSATKNERIVQKLQAALWKLDSADNPQIDKRVIMLGSIDKEMMIKIFDNASYFPDKLRQFIIQYNTKSEAELNLKENFLKIYDHLTADFDKLEDLLLFANFLLQKVYLIAIITNGSEVKAFSIFEAINSKGKKLEDIDLIKTYIFSRLNEADYASCLSQWGDLILKTGDRLYDFLKTYIKAYIKYYSQNISFNNFKKLGDVLLDHFKKSDLGEAYKELLSDMLEKVEYYKALTDLDSAYTLVHDSKFRFYYSVFIKIKYELPNPLFFRLFAEYGQGNITREALIEIVIETIKSVVSFITICQKDSKDIINVFSSIFDGISKNNVVDKDLVLYLLSSKMQTSGLRKEDISSSLSKMDLYEKNKQLGVAIISIYESRAETGKLKVSWDEAFSKFSTFGKAYSLDHIMVQTPKPFDERLKYYQLGDTLKLKKGHDFPESLVHEGMEYSAFKNLVLHRAGNLRLKGKDENLDRSNKSDDTLNTYKGLDERTNLIVQFIMENFLNFETITETASIASALSGMSKKQIGTFDFSLDDLDLTGIKAKQLTIFDKVFELEHNKDILIDVVLYLYNENEEKLLSMASHNWSPRRRAILSKQSDLLLTPYEMIKDQIYIETNLSSKDIIFYSKELLREFNFPADLVSIYIPE